MAKVLLVEDDKALSNMTAHWLSMQKHVVEQAFAGDEAADRLRLYDYDLIIMDWELPGMSGISVTNQYRKNGGTAPILFLTGKSELPDKVEGFNSGADDYLTKPFEIPELKVRIEALLRRPKALLPQVLKHRHIQIDLLKNSVEVDNQEVKLMPKEFALLTFLVKNKGHVFDHNAILNKVWSSESDATSEAIMTCVKRLRKKLDIDGQPSIITTVHGMGYRVD